MNPLGMFGDENADYCTALADALELLSCCEAIILCPGWEKSTGCRAEKAYAIHTGIKITYLNEFNAETAKEKNDECGADKR